MGTVQRRGALGGGGARGDQVQIRSDLRPASPGTSGQTDQLAFDVGQPRARVGDVGQRLIDVLRVAAMETLCRCDQLAG